MIRTSILVNGGIQGTQSLNSIYRAIKLLIKKDLVESIFRRDFLYGKKYGLTETGRRVISHRIKTKSKKGCSK